jgi:hypothetical protein
MLPAIWLGAILTGLDAPAVAVRVMAGAGLAPVLNTGAGTSPAPTIVATGVRRISAMFYPVIFFIKEMSYFRASF